MFESGLILVDVEGKQLDVIMFRNLRSIGMLEASKRLARDLAGLLKECG
jgi:hypothetical protein